MLHLCCNEAFFQNCAVLVPLVERRHKLLEPLLYFPKSSHLKRNTLWTTCHRFFFLLLKPAFPVSNTVRYWFAKFVLQLFGGLYDCSFQASGTKASASIISDIKAMGFFFWRQMIRPLRFFCSIICCRLGYRKPSTLSPRLTLSGLAFPSSPGFLRRLGPFLPLLHDAAGISS